MNNIAVSIVIPIYNAEKYLYQCIESAVNQTLTNIEVILINDGSTDGSEKICKEFIEKDKRIKYLYKKNEGLAAARQDGVNMASGDYIGFIDSDDWVEVDMYEKMYNAASSNNSDVVLCDCFEYDEKKGNMGIDPGAYDQKQIKEDIIKKTLIRIDEKGNRRNIRWSNCLRIYKRDTIKKYDIKFDRRFRRCQDLPFTYEMMLHSENFYYLGEYLYHNRQDAGSLSRGYTKNMWQLIRPLIRHIYDLSEKFEDIVDIQVVHSTAFFLIIDCILNEFKSDAPFWGKKRKNITNILQDQICVNCAKKLEYDRLNKYYKKVFYSNIKNRKAVKLVIAYYYYNSKLKRKVIMPLLHYFTETRVYKLIRRY